MATSLAPLNHRIRHLDTALSAALTAILGDHTKPGSVGIEHDALLHEGPTQADDDEMSYCPNCHVVSNLMWLRDNLAGMVTKGVVVDAASVERVEGDDA